MYQQLLYFNYLLKCQRWEFIFFYLINQTNKRKNNTFSGNGDSCEAGENSGRTAYLIQLSTISATYNRWSPPWDPPYHFR